MSFADYTITSEVHNDGLSSAGFFVQVSTSSKPVRLKMASSHRLRGFCVAGVGEQENSSEISVSMHQNSDRLSARSRGVPDDEIKA
jgi:hypothetical protein